MNRYLKRLSKIEFVLTDACTGRCKHCSQGDHSASSGCIDARLAADAVKRIAAEYEIKTVMTFGGEPLLYPETVCLIMSAAADLNIPRRQVITNGYFSKNPDRIRAVAEELLRSGVNDLLLSVDAFHEEAIPLDIVRIFATELKRIGVPTRLQPAWLVSADADNEYNLKTRKIIESFADLGFATNEGNVVFPEGNAAKYLAEYFISDAPKNPYEEDPADVRCISFAANGDVLGSNFYTRDIMDIIAAYDPFINT